MTVVARNLPSVAIVTIGFVLVVIGSAHAIPTDGFSPPPASGAPGPITGVGLPVLAAIGYGAYWLVKRFRNKAS